MRKTTFKKGLSVLACGAMMLLASCSHDDLENDNSRAQRTSINDYVYALPSVQQINPFRERLVNDGQAHEVGLNMQQYRPTRAYMTRASKFEEEYEQAKEVEEMLLFTEDQELFYPGALIRSKEWVTGNYLPIEVERKPLTLSTTLLGKEKSVVTVENPTLSSIRAGMNELLTKEYDAPAANITYSSEEVFDEEHLKIAMGFNYSGAGGSAKANGMFDYKKERNRFLVKIQQVFYTIDVDKPRTPADFIAIPEGDYERQIGNEKPVYVSSIKMGRVFLLGIETTLSKIEAQAKIQASFLSGSVGVEAETAFDNLKKNSTITARVLGGDAKLSAQAITDIKQVPTLLAEGARFSRENPGAPIAYKLRELGTNKPFKTVIYSKYHKNGARFKDNKLDFTVRLSGTSLKTSAGEQLEEVGVSHIVVKRKDASTSKRELKFLTGWIADAPLSGLQVGDKVYMEIDRTAKGDKYKKLYTFELPDIESLMRRTEQLRGSKPLYDPKESEPLIITDTNKEVTLSLIIKDQKLY